MSPDEHGIFDAKKLVAGRPDNLHKGSASSSPARERQTDEPDIDGMIERSGCAASYFALEECLGDNDRDWKKCQYEVHALKKCSLSKSEEKR